MEMRQVYDEQELLKSIAQGDEAAFARLFDAWRDKLFFFTLRITQSHQQAEDLVQDVFLKLWLNRSSLGGIENFRAWLYRVIQNQAISGLRRMALETSVLAKLKKENIGSGEPADEILLQKQLQQKLHEAINQLPPRQKEIYTLTRIDGLKQEEVASRLNISISTVQNHMTEALRRLRLILGKDYSVVTTMLVWIALAS